MRAIVLEKFGGPDSLVIKEIPEPEPRAGHVVTRSERLAAGRWND
jgi:NADPH:quinone reductase